MIIRGRRPKLAKSRSELAPYTEWLSETAGRDGLGKRCGGVRTRPHTEGLARVSCREINSD